MNINKKNIILASVAVIAVTASTLFLLNKNDNFMSIKSDASTYTLTLDGDNGIIPATSYAEEERNGTALTPSNNVFTYTYYNAMQVNTTYNPSKDGYFGQFKKQTGYMFTPYGVNGLSSITVTYDSDTEGATMSLYLSSSTTFSGSAKTVTSGTAINVSNKSYFRLQANDNL